MRILLIVFFSIFCTTVLAQDPLTTTTTDATTLTDTTPTVTTTVAPVTQSSTTSSSTSTTPASSSTSSTAPSSTTTVASSSSTPEITSTTVPSTQAPEVKECKFYITQRNVTCIRAEMKAKFIIDIQGTKHPIVLGCNASTTGSGDCSSNETQTLVIFEPNYYNLTMIFEKEDNHVFVRNVSFSYILPEGQDEAVNNTENLFAVSAGNSYLCKSPVDIQLRNVTMQVSDVHIQAFLEKDNNDFGTVKQCELDEKVSDIVPIAVGVALGALIIIVLIAYLVGRRRSRQRGYQSV